jgi:hypothetical protein
MIETQCQRPEALAQLQAQGLTLALARHYLDATEPSPVLHQIDQIVQ